MTTPSSCRRCSKPLALTPPSALCPTCAAVETADRTPPRSAPDEPTADAPPHPGTPTVTAHPDATTDGPSGCARPLPGAPAGYELLDRLGGGGMGEVYLAREHTSERLVAMKFLRHPGDPDALARFERELRVLARLDHPHIVRVLASDFLRPDPYFTMEYLPGGPLGRSADPPLPPAEAVRLVRTVAAAVGAAHAERVIHRDLKPSNILVAADGAPKVSDFGLAKRLDEADPLTVASGGLGTPGYMPPEQVSRRHGDVGPWSDVYGLGATLYRLLTGRAPFVGDTPAEVITQVLSDLPTRPRAICPAVPPALEGIVAKCLEKDPRARYQTAAELVADLDRWEAGDRPAAPPLTPVRRARRWAQRNRRRVLAGAAAALLVVGAFALGAAAWPRPAAVAPNPPEDPQDAIRAALAKGQTVTLVGPTGYPDWLAKNWLTNPAALAPAPTAGGACSFETIRPTLLALLKDPGRDSYRVSAEFRLLRTAAADPKKRPTEAEAVNSGTGLFLGHVAARGPDGSEVHAALLVHFADYYPPEWRQAFGLTEAAVQTESLLLVDLPDREFLTYRPGLRPARRFPPAPTLPGEWRVLQAEVRPSGVKLFWAEAPDRAPEPLAEAPADVLARGRAGLQDWLDVTLPNRGIRLAGWSPRAPFGVWGNGSAVAFRNVTVDPL